MALPTLQRKLFQNDGYGPLLKDEIVSRHISVQDWSNAYDYPVATVARGSDGVLYYSKLQSGPGTGAGAVDPTMDDGTYWTAPKVPAMPRGDNSDAAASTKWVNQWLSDSVITPSDVYADPSSGDDSNDGLTPSTAKKTIASCLDLLCGSDPVGIPRAFGTVHLAAGVYDESLLNDHRIQEIIYLGPSSGWAAVNTVEAANNQIIRLGGNIRIKTGGLVQSARGGMLYFTSGLKLNFNSWSASQALYAFQGGQIYLAYGFTAAISFTGSCSASTAVVRVTYGSKIVCFGNGLSWSGSVSGTKYTVAYLSLLSGMGSSSAIPGSTAGNVDASSVFHT